MPKPDLLLPGPVKEIKSLISYPQGDASVVTHRFDLLQKTNPEPPRGTNLPLYRFFGAIIDQDWEIMYRVIGIEYAMMVASIRENRYQSINNTAGRLNNMDEVEQDWEVIGRKRLKYFTDALDDTERLYDFVNKAAEGYKHLGDYAQWVTLIDLSNGNPEKHPDFRLLNLDEGVIIDGLVKSRRLERAQAADNQQILKMLRDPNNDPLATRVFRRRQRQIERQLKVMGQDPEVHPYAIGFKLATERVQDIRMYLIENERLAA